MLLPMVLSYSKLKEWKWNSSGVDGEGLLCGKHQVQEAGDQSAAAAIHLQHSITHTWTYFYYEHGSILITTIGEAKQSEVCKQPHESLQRVPRIGEEIMRLSVKHEINISSITISITTATFTITCYITATCYITIIISSTSSDPFRLLNNLSVDFLCHLVGHHVGLTVDFLVHHHHDHPWARNTEKKIECQKRWWRSWWWWWW